MLVCYNDLKGKSQSYEVYDNNKLLINVIDKGYGATINEALLNYKINLRDYIDNLKAYIENEMSLDEPTITIVNNLGEPIELESIRRPTDSDIKSLENSILKLKVEELNILKRR